MMIKTRTLALAAAALTVVVSSGPVSAQESCAGMYSQMMGLYQTAPYSPEYAQMSAYYSSRCLAGAPYPQPYAYQPAPVYQPAPYGYPAYAPAPVDPGAAILGAAILGGVIAAESDHGGRRWHGDRRWNR